MNIIKVKTFDEFIGEEMRLFGSIFEPGLIFIIEIEDTGAQHLYKTNEDGYIETL